MERPHTAAGARDWLRAGALVFASASAAATGLQVSPTSLNIPAARSAAGIWLSNSGDAILHAQVRVYHWTQENGADALVRSQGLVISPPMLDIAPGARQLVRVIRMGRPPQANEDAYRIVVDELPLEDPISAAGQAVPSADNNGALHYVLRYSVPVFLTSADAASAQPTLSGDVVRGPEGLKLTLSNRGSMHAQLGNLELIDTAGKRSTLVPGLVGYVLPGQTMYWPLSIDAAALAQGAQLRSRINGEPSERMVASLHPRLP